MKSKKHWVKSLLVAAGLVLGAITTAAPASAQLCSFNISAPHFANADLLAGAPIDTFGGLTISCSGVANQVVQVCANFDAGSGGAATDGSARYLIQASNQINYNMFQDSARSVVWGSTLGGMGATSPPNILVGLNASGTGNANASIYARLFGQQSTAPVGLYSSGITATIRYAYYSGLGCASLTGATTVQTASINANYVAGCLINATPLNFGNIGIITAPIDSLSVLSVKCSNGSSYSVALDGGLTGASDPTLRRMKFSTNTLFYGLFQDPARQYPWGPTLPQSVLGTGSGGIQEVPVYGRIRTQQTPPPGLYLDTIVATVTY